MYNEYVDLQNEYLDTVRELEDVKLKKRGFMQLIWKIPVYYVLLMLACGVSIIGIAFIAMLFVLWQYVAVVVILCAVGAVYFSGKMTKLEQALNLVEIELHEQMRPNGCEIVDKYVLLGADTSSYLLCKYDDDKFSFHNNFELAYEDYFWEGKNVVQQHSGSAVTMGRGNSFFKPTVMSGTTKNQEISSKAVLKFRDSANKAKSLEVVVNSQDILKLEQLFFV